MAQFGEEPMVTKSIGSENGRLYVGDVEQPVEGPA